MDDIIKNNTMLNMNIVGSGPVDYNSDDEQKKSPGKKGVEYFDNDKLTMTNIKPPKQEVGSLGAGFDVNALAGKLGEIHDEEEEQARKKEAFEKKRNNHYKNEFQMAKAMMAKQMAEEEDEEND